MPTYKLNSTSGDQALELPSDRPVIVGRAVTSDFPVYDPTVSRKHAELTVGPTGVRVTDMGSSNGTYVNGTRLNGPVTVVDGDVVTFGKVAFHLKEVTPRPAPRPAPDTGASRPEATIIRQLPVREGTSLEQQVVLSGGPSHVKVKGASVEERQATKFQLLLEISKELAKQQDVDKLLDKVVDITFQVMDVDRVSILMVDDGTGELIPRLSKNRLGDSGGSRHVPRSIAQRCVDERLAILTDNAVADERFKGQSILMQSVRSAMSTPLMGSEGNVLGILYVDNMTATNSFGDEDLEFLIAFSGIAAVAIEVSQLTARLAREAVVVSNFKRFFAPNLIDQIVGREGVIELGGTKHPVVIFFSDIRGFTPLSTRMGPDEIASLLNEYFTEMVDIVFEHGGTLDKFMGDAVMALWGAPLAQPDAADRAMRAAFESLTALEKLNQKWAAEGRQHIDIGIGINYGEVFAGNIGSNRRLEYTVIGDPVNVAFRLCSHAGPGEVIVSEPFYQQLAEAPPAEELGLKVKGKEEEVRAYRVKV